MALKDGLLTYQVRSQIEYICSLQLTKVDRGIESMSIIITRNITTIILLCVLAIQSVRLLMGVVNETFDVRDMRASFLYNYSNLMMFWVYVS